MGSENVRGMTHIYLPGVFAYPYITGWCYGDVVILQKDDTSFKFHPVYPLQLFMFFFIYLSLSTDYVTPVYITVQVLLGGRGGGGVM
jgi:hypothetical protein